MITKNIRFNSIKEAVDFVNAASRQPYDVDLSRGIYNVDAKSILGVLALGLGNIIRMEIHADGLPAWSRSGVYEVSGRMLVCQQVDFLNTF